MTATSDVRARVHQDRLVLPSSSSESEPREPTLAKPVTHKFYESKVAKVHDETDPLRYSWGNEYRARPELDSIVEQLAGKPVTMLHPADLFLNGAKSVEDQPGETIGYVDSARVEGDYVVAMLCITNEQAFGKIETGIDQISLGYMSVADEGGWQHDIKVDHVAVVPRGRCKTCELRADAHADCGDDHACACSTGAPDGQVHPQVHSTSGQSKNHAVSQVVSMAADIKQDGKLNAEERKKLPSHLFANPETRQEPLEDEGHVRAAMSRFGQTHFQGPAARKAAFHRIVARAHELGMDPSGFEKEHGEMSSKKDDDFTGDPAQYQDALSEIKKLKDALEKAEMDRDNAQKDMKALREGMDAKLEKAVKDALDAHAAKAASDAKDAAEKAVNDARKDAEDAFATKVDVKIELLATANAVLPEDKRVDARKPDREIKLAVIKHVDGDDCVGKSDGYVDGMYDGALKRAKIAADSRATARIVAAGPNVPAPAPEHVDDVGDPNKKPTEAELRDRANKRAASAWQRPTTN